MDTLLHPKERSLSAIFLHCANSVIDKTTGKPLEYRHLIAHEDPQVQEDWNLSGANEFGRLAQGVGGHTKGTNTIRFIYKHEVPKNKTVTYARFVCNERPQKKELNWTPLM